MFPVEESYDSGSHQVFPGGVTEFCPRGGPAARGCVFPQGGSRLGAHASPSLRSRHADQNTPGNKRLHRVLDRWSILKANGVWRILRNTPDLVWATDAYGVLRIAYSEEYARSCVCKCVWRIVYCVFMCMVRETFTPALYRECGSGFFLHHQHTPKSGCVTARDGGSSVASFPPPRDPAECFL